jgi:hypothetical protein
MLENTSVVSLEYFGLVFFNDLVYPCRGSSLAKVVSSSAFLDLLAS